MSTGGIYDVRCLSCKSVFVGALQICRKPFCRERFQIVPAIPARTPPFADALLGEEGNNNLHPRCLVRIATAAIPTTACRVEECKAFFKVRFRTSSSRPTYLCVVCNAHQNDKPKFEEAADRRFGGGG